MTNDQIQLIVFDMAGTTVQDNNEVQQCFMQAADRTQLTADPAKVTQMMGWSKKLVFQTLWAEQLGTDHPEYAAKVEESFAQFKQILENHYRTQPVQPTEGCLELFEWMRSHHIKIALTTGFYREVTDIILDRLGWHQGLNREHIGTEHTFIQASITPSEIYCNEGRPAPFMIQKAMYRLGMIDSKTVINIGDTPSDLESGFNANCLLSYGVTGGTHTKAQLEQHPNDGLFENLHKFRERLIDLTT